MSYYIKVHKIVELFVFDILSKPFNVQKPRLIKNTGLHQNDGYWSSKNTIAT